MFKGETWTVASIPLSLRQVRWAIYNKSLLESLLAFRRQWIDMDRTWSASAGYNRGCGLLGLHVGILVGILVVIHDGTVWCC